LSSADLLITDVEIVDGTGAPSFPGFVIVSGDRIAHVGHEGEAEPAEGPRRIQAVGRTLCPGFIDVHNHSDLVPFVEPWMDSALRQGVTSLVVGNCGSSAFPPEGAPELAALIGVEPGGLDVSWTSCGGYLEAVDACHPAVNLATLIGHGALRLAAMGMERRSPTAEEMATMRRLLREGMQAGAVGMASGLVYFPGMYARTEEVAELAPFDGVYASHIRGEGTMLFDAIDEAFRIARHAGVPAHVSHLKLESSLAWGQIDRVLGIFDDARAGGLDATADQYPYPAWAST
jgi:N-acyl-D-amino-acid deacylase